MCAGKTTELLRRYERETVHDKRVALLVNHVSDTRFCDDGVRTHSGKHEERCVRAAHLDEVEVGRDVAHVFVNEGQFFDDLVAWCLRMSRRGVGVTVAALNANSDQHPWPNVAALEPWCERTDKLTARCKCGREATLSVRRDSAPAHAVDVGGSEKYDVCCLRCFDAM